MARYLPSIRTRAPESEQYFAVPGQEILKLLGCKDIYIEYFPEALHQKKKREDKLKIWKRDCPGQFLCGSKGLLSENSKWSGSPFPKLIDFLLLSV